jgi:hypothetical protein
MFTTFNDALLKLSFKLFLSIVHINVNVQVLSVRNGNGQDLKDARFVEILRSAGTRIKSAHDNFKCKCKWQQSCKISIFSIIFNFFQCEEMRGVLTTKEKDGKLFPGKKIT